MANPLSRFLAFAAPIVLSLSIGSISGAAAQSEVAYRDGNGRWRVVDTDDAPAVAAASQALKASTTGVFNLSYEDVEAQSGVGFDDPQLGVVRRETLEAVVAYLDSVLEARGSADILIGGSQVDGGGPLAIGGPFLFLEAGFQGGFVFDHLMTGVDPEADVPDAFLTVDFGYPWNSDLDPPSVEEFDLYTVLLHELTHALGLISLAASDGSSAIFNTGEGTGLFSRMDDFLVHRSSGRDLYRTGGEIHATSEDLVSGDVVFSGPRSMVAFGDPPPVFAPNPFIEGSSIGHWAFSTGANVVLLPFLEEGVARREYPPWEIEVLADLGYRSQEAVCGDAIVDYGEDCDDGNADNEDACLATCAAATCGDGFVQAGVEACDGGDANSDTKPDACRTDCVDPYCGDGVIDGNEECDPANLFRGPSCSAACISEVVVSMDEPDAGVEDEPPPLGIFPGGSGGCTVEAGGKPMLGFSAWLLLAAAVVLRRRR